MSIRWNLINLLLGVFVHLNIASEFDCAANVSIAGNYTINATSCYRPSICVTANARSCAPSFTSSVVSIDQHLILDGCIEPRYSVTNNHTTILATTSPADVALWHTGAGVICNQSTLPPIVDVRITDTEADCQWVLVHDLSWGEDGVVYLNIDWTIEEQETDYTNDSLSEDTGDSSTKDKIGDAIAMLVFWSIFLAIIICCFTWLQVVAVGVMTTVLFMMFFALLVLVIIDECFY
jgi:hypothetical protein